MGLLKKKYDERFHVNWHTNCGFGLQLALVRKKFTIITIRRKLIYAHLEFVYPQATSGNTQSLQ